MYVSFSGGTAVTANEVITWTDDKLLGGKKISSVTFLCSLCVLLCVLFNGIFQNKLYVHSNVNRLYDWMILVLEWIYYMSQQRSELKCSKHNRQWGSEDRWGTALMRGFCHWAGYKPEPNVNCEVLDFDKTECCLSDTLLTALNLRPDHIQIPSTSMYCPPLFFLNGVWVFSLFLTASLSWSWLARQRQFTSIFFFPIDLFSIPFLSGIVVPHLYRYFSLTALIAQGSS